MEPTRIGPYRLETEIGVGGMGKVYRAFDERLVRPVAIKQVSRPIARKGLERDRLWREARATARLSHPAVVQVFDIVSGEEDDWIVMELVEGRSLTSLIESGPLDLGAALPILCDVTEALAEAHGKGILHRDLKTDNVMVTEQGRTKLLDFGLAQPIAQDAGDRLTIEGRIVGTPHAMSPEQAMSLELDHRSDLFSLGTLFYETLAGQRPFRGDDLVATLHRVCVARQPPARELNAAVPEELSSLIDRLLEKDPERRPQSAGAVAGALRRLAARQPLDHAFPDPEAPTRSATPMASRSRAATSSGERRQLTVVHCDLASCATSSGALDPEDLLEVRPQLERLAAEVTERWEGVVGEAREQGLRLLFGYPRAHENDARRAVHAAREIAVAIRKIAARAGDDELALKVGVHTGPAVVATAPTSPRGETRELVLGETASVAAGLASLAEPDSVLISAATRAIVAPFARTEPMPPARVPGLARRLEPHRYLGDADAEATAELFASKAPLVARSQELELLLDRWQLAAEGTGQVVLLGGEAGIGKSRLVHALRARLAGSASSWLTAQCSPFDAHTPFAPVKSMVRRLLAPDGGDLDAATVTAFARPYAADLPALAPVLADLLALPHDPSSEGLSQALSPQAKRRRTLESLVALFHRLAEPQPLLLLVEDLHWADASTLELLERLIDHAQGLPILLLLTFRPDIQPPGGHRTHTTRLTLGRLNRAQAGDMVSQLAGDAPLAPEVVAMIVERTDGVPLFVEEVTRAVLEASAPGVPSPVARQTGTGSHLPVSIPSTLQASLAARLDRLGSAKAVAQQASALGRTFRREVLAAVSALPEEDLDDDLKRLVEAELIFRQGLGPDARYSFKHALLQDAAYQSLLSSERRELHRTIAEALADRFPEMAEEQPEVLAHHRTEAGQAQRAVSLWLRAGQRASERSANAEAIAHLSHGLEACATLPAGAERDSGEIDLRIARGLSWMAAEGYATQAGVSDFRRAHELCRKPTGDPRAAMVSSGLFIYHLIRAEHDSAHQHALEVLHLARQQNDPDLLLDAHRVCGSSALYRGDLETAREHVLQGLELQRSKEPGYDVLMPSDPGVNCLFFAAWLSWLEGYPEQALEKSRAGLALAREIDHPYSLALALCCAADLHLYRREPAAGLELAEAAVAVAVEQGFAYWQLIARTLRGFARVTQGRQEEGVAELREALDVQRQQGMQLNRPRFLCLLAEACGGQDVAAGLAATAQARAAIENNGERHFAPEVYRLRGELLSSSSPGGGGEEAEACLRQALEEARRQGARSLELRAAMGLSKLWQTAGRRRPARELLAATCDAFTEGFDTADLAAARRLLEELS